MRFRVLTTASLLALAGCHLHSDPPGEAPSGVVVTPGEGLVTVNWDRDSELTYWIFYQPGSSVVPAAPGVPLIFDAVPPRVVAGLVNETPYAFIMNATREDSKAGPSSPVIVKKPRLAGAEWVPGTALGTPPTNLNGIAFNGGSRLVVVGNLGTIFAGDYNYTNTNPLGVTAWMPPTALPPGFNANLSAVIFSGLFVALGTDGSILTSTDGLTWTAATAVPPGAVMNGITFGVVGGSGIYVAVGGGGSIFTSPDLVTWTPAAVSNPPNTGDLFGVAFLNNLFLATGAGGTLLTSVDGINWTAQTSNTPSTLRATAFRSAPTPLYVVVGDSGTIVTSADATTWNPPIAPTPLPLTAVRFGSRFVAVGQGGGALYSDDGSSWSIASGSSGDLSGVVYTPSMYVAVGAAGANEFSK